MKHCRLSHKYFISEDRYQESVDKSSPTFRYFLDVLAASFDSEICKGSRSEFSKCNHYLQQIPSIHDCIIHLSLSALFKYCHHTKVVGGSYGTDWRRDSKGSPRNDTDWHTFAILCFWNLASMIMSFITFSNLHFILSHQKTSTCSLVNSWYVGAAIFCSLRGKLEDKIVIPAISIIIQLSQTPCSWPR